MSRAIRGAVLGLTLLSLGDARAENWPSWHGSHPNAISPDRDLPLKWSSTQKLGNWIYATPVVSASADLVIVICGFKGPTTAVRPGGRGDVTATHRVWQTAGRSPERIGTGIIHQGRLYVPEALGIINCFDAATGKSLWKERLGGNLWGSILLAGDRLYVANLEGETYVLSAGPKYEQLAKNSIPESTYAALAAADGEFFLRTHEHLYCISRSSPRSAEP